MSTPSFVVGDRVRVKNSKMLGRVVAVDAVNLFGPFVYPSTVYSVSFDEGNDGLRFSLGESMLELESPLESLASVAS